MDAKLYDQEHKSLKSLGKARACHFRAVILNYFVMPP